jgi:hypothetical protein
MQSVFFLDAGHVIFLSKLPHVRCVVFYFVLRTNRNRYKLSNFLKLMGFISRQIYPMGR